MGVSQSRCVDYWERVTELCRKHSMEDMELLDAVKEGNKRSMDRWMKRGARVNTRNADGRTPLMVAALEGHAQCAEQLIHRWDADVNALRKTKRKYTYYYPSGRIRVRTIPHREIKHGETALTCATANGHHQCVDVLLVAGADVNGTDEDGLTSLHIASRLGYPLCVQLLIQAGADLNIFDKFQKSPLMYTAAGPIDRSGLRCLELLFQAGAPVNKTNRCGENAVMLHFTLHEPVNKQALLLLLAAGERLKTRRLAGYPRAWDKKYCRVKIPVYILFRRKHLCLKHICREAIRKHLLKLSPVNLLIRVPEIGLPSILTSYILYGVYLHK